MKRAVAAEAQRARRRSGGLALPTLLRPWRLCGLLPFLWILSCAGDTVPVGLRATPPGTGPTVVFDVTHKPFPEVPLPNDFATFADPTSRTGRRINVSLIATTGIERIAREAFNEMEGWGTLAPISVQFQRSADEDPHESAIDLDEVRARMQHDGHDMSNDPVYVVNLDTGIPVMLDMGDGNFPLVLRDLDRYWPNDPHLTEQNLILETLEEGPGLTQADYTPALDTDFDGVLDHPDTLGPATQWPGVDNLLTWYERETDTLILRPLLPLEEKTEYAVLLTDRLIGQDGQPVRSPFPDIHHPFQKDSVARAGRWLSDPSRAAYFGDLAGTGFDHIAFAWTFTTQPVHEDMRLLHDGLYAKGPFASFASLAPVVKSDPSGTPRSAVNVFPVAGKAPVGTDEPAGWQQDPSCASRLKTPYVVKPNDPDIHSALHDIYMSALGLDAGDTAWLERAVSNIDHIVVGTFTTPYLEGDPADTDPEEARFHLDFRTGQGDIRTDTVHFWLHVPVATAQHPPPFPVVLYGHGVTSDDTESIVYAGDFAKQGIALMMIDMPEHGTVMDKGTLSLARGSTNAPCLVPWIDAVDQGRARDYDGSGTAESGWFWWTSHVFHVRDNVRQGTLDQMQAVRALKSFDGKLAAGQDFNGNGQLDDLAGDFDGDGTVDVGGPSAQYFASGESLGGIMSEILGGIEPSVVAAAPMSGGNGLSYIGIRSYGVTEAVIEQIFGPLVVSIPATDRPPQKSVKQTNCTDTQRSVRILYNDGDRSVEMEIACLDPTEDDVGMTVVVTNGSSKEVRCARTLANGAFRVEIPSTKGDRLDIQLYGAPDAVDSYATCNVPAGTPVGRRIKTFEQPAPAFSPVGDPSKTCPNGSSCAQFRDTFYPVGDPLVAANDGYGIKRQSPTMRRLFDLVQAAIDPADPGNFAPYYMLRPLLDENGTAVPPHALLATSTVGDGFVNIATGQAFARAAGALPFLPPSAIRTMPEYGDYVTPTALFTAFGGQTPNDVLLANGVIEGIARLGRTHAGPLCAVNYVSPPTTLCPTPPNVDTNACMNALFDPDWVSEGAQDYDQPHPHMPLRLARIAGLHPTDPASLDAAWAPREQGVPFSPDETGWAASAPIVGMFDNYIQPGGKHTWDVGSLCYAFDQSAYGNGIMARLFATGGRDVYYLSHPTTHRCLATLSCDFEQP